MVLLPVLWNDVSIIIHIALQLYEKMMYINAVGAIYTVTYYW